MTGEIDIIIHEKTGDLITKYIQIFEVVKREHSRVKLDFNWYMKTLPMHELLEIPMANFGIASGVLGIE